MSYKELNRDQILALKQNYLVRTQDGVSYNELAEADNLVSDEELEQEYKNVNFVEGIFKND